MIPNEFIQTLLGRVDIVEVIDRLVPLKKAGANLVACCPFHSEKTPSFTVSPVKQFYHCFGCGAHGTAIGFLMEHSGKPFVDAVRELATQVGLEVPESEGHRDARAEAENDRGLELLREAARFFRLQLKESPLAIEYLRGRGLTGQVAARFGIGFAPAGWQALAQIVPDYGDPMLETTGLVIVGDGGKRYDRFRERIMFPIIDTRGQVIGFGGRVLDRGEPKYLNSPETPFFSKGRELYGLFQARQAIRDSGAVIVVEGYMDVVALAQHGVENVVATLGTALTPAHAQRLLRQADRVYFCFDGDSAGERAAWRALENTLPALADGKDVRFVFLPDGKDPDDFVRDSGREAFDRFLGAALPLSDYLLRELSARHPTGTAEGIAALIADARPLLREVNAPIFAALLARRFAEISGLAPGEILAPGAAGAPRGTPQSTTAERRGSAPPARGPRSRPMPSESRQALKLLLALPPLAAGYAGIPAGADGPETRTLAAVREILADPETARRATTAYVLQQLDRSEHADLAYALAAEIEDEALDEQALRAEFDALVVRRADRAASDRLTEVLRNRRLDSLTEEERKMLSGYRRDTAPTPASGGDTQ